MDVLTPLKPKLRGWLHLGMAPLIQLAGLILLVVTPSLLGRIGLAVYLVGATMLFATSAIYHRGSWGQRMSAFLRRTDHANIFVFIAGTYTPLALMLLTGWSRTLLLTLIWSIAAAGIGFKMGWMNAPAGSTPASTSPWAGWRSAGSCRSGTPAGHSSCRSSSSAA